MKYVFLTVKNISPYWYLVSECKEAVSLVLPSISIIPLLPESLKCDCIDVCAWLGPTSEFPLTVVLPFGFTLKQVVASEALVTYELSESIPVCHVSVIPSRENWIHDPLFAISWWNVASVQ